jgi:hypothetical protein
MPRIGFAWQKSPHVVFRGGYGITNYLEGTGAALRLNYNPPFQNSFSRTAQTPTATSAGIPITLESGLPIGSSAPITSYNAWDKNLKPAFIQEFTFGNEIQLNNQTSVSMTYLGQIGNHLIDPRAANQLPAPGAPAPYANLVGQTGSVVETQSESVMRYHALQIQVRRRQFNGLEYQVNYTWSHALTNNAGFSASPTSTARARTGRTLTVAMPTTATPVSISATIFRPPVFISCRSVAGKDFAAA